MFSKELHFDLNRLDSNFLLSGMEFLRVQLLLKGSSEQHLKQKTKTQRDTSKNDKNLSKLH